MLEGYESDLELSSSEPVKEDAPKEEVTPEVTPSEEVPKEEVAETPADPNPEAPVVDDGLFELPDGRRVDIETAQREWKENFLPEFTRKSQRLAELERGGKDIKSEPVEKKEEWKDPDYVPKSYAEIVEIAKAEAIRSIRDDAAKEVARVEAVKEAIDLEIGEIRKIDPKLDENALFNHANKYGFQDLKAAHKNMMDMKSVIVSTEQKVIKNLKTRETDPVSDAASPASKEDDSYDPMASSKFDSASDYLSFLKAKK